ncbi:MAG: hypothetical protein LBV13_00385 [Methanomassiliicoccaceae archaeon]|nr:hypothetical protein [Methanomassiliicoccaceae archaeon]
MSETLTLAAAAVLTAVLISASVHDLRSREVPDVHWMVAGAAGILMMCASMFDGGVTIWRMMIVAGSAMIVADILYDRERSVRIIVMTYALMAAMFIIPLAVSYDDTFVKHSLAVPLCFILFVMMFHTGVIKGGADVKCLITVAVLFPMYPVMYGYPMIDAPSSIISDIISFPIAVLFHAALFSMTAVIPMAIRNIRRGDIQFPRMLSCYRMNAADVKNAHVWPAEDVNGSTDGRIWVTPKIPFIIPITVAVIFVMFIGNILFAMV